MNYFQSLFLQECQKNLIKWQRMHTHPESVCVCMRESMSKYQHTHTHYYKEKIGLVPRKMKATNFHFITQNFLKC